MTARRPYYTRRQQPKPQNFTSAPGAASPAQPKPIFRGDKHLWCTLQKIVDTVNGQSATTRAMTVPGGLVINTVTRTPQGLSEALTFVPGAGLGASADGVCITALKSTST